MNILERILIRISNGVPRTSHREQNPARNPEGIPGDILTGNSGRTIGGILEIAGGILGNTPERISGETNKETLAGIYQGMPRRICERILEKFPRKNHPVGILGRKKKEILGRTPTRFSGEKKDETW